MRSDDLLDDLIGPGVLEPSEDGELLSVPAEFWAAVEETESALERRASLADGLRERFDDPEVVEALAAVGEDDLSFVAHYCVLADRAESLAYDDLVRAVAVLVQLQESPPRTEGAPGPFLPVQGDQLSTLLGLAPRAVVYVWREECEPCDLVCETFEEIFEGGLDDVALFAVHGPDWAELLYHEYDVNGAPATLFVVDGQVDSRLYGAHFPEAYEGEIEKLRELT